MIMYIDFMLRVEVSYIVYISTHCCNISIIIANFQMTFLRNNTINIVGDNIIHNIESVEYCSGSSPPQDISS